MRVFKLKSMVMLFCIVTMLLLEGCSGKHKMYDMSGEAEALASSTSNEVIFLDDENVMWKDNALDDLQAIFNIPVHRFVPNGIITGGRGCVMVGEGGSVIFKQHLFSDYRINWSGVNGVAADGEGFSYRIEAGMVQTGALIECIGQMAGGKGYVAENYVRGDGNELKEQWFYELDECFQVIWSVKAERPISDRIECLMGDADGNYHLIYRMTNGRMNYGVLSQDGTMLMDVPLDFSAKLYAFGEGRVSVCTDCTNTQQRMYMADIDKEKLIELPVSKDENVKQKLSGFVMAVSPLDENSALWCTEEGIFVYDLKDRSTKTVYQWSKHGLSVMGIRDMVVTAEGSVGILYKDKYESDLCYLLLKPTGEREELPSITVAVSPYNKDAFLKTATLFNKMYPSYVINVKDDYDATSLLTQLGAGAGPVLVDTELTGFEDLEKLWQPLDGFLEQTGIANELIPKALEFGKIGDVTYGIVRDFRIDTLITSDSVSGDWDYEGFLSALEQCNGAAFTYEYVDGFADYREQYFGLLENGLWDNYYFDAKTGKTIFGTSDFERVLKLSKKAEQCPSTEEGKTLRNGSALCEQTYLLVEAQVFRLRRRMEANGEHIAGFPTKNGAANLLVANAPLAMRSTATEEEKKIAYTFLKTYLSKEAMEANVAGMFPVRRDVFDTRLKNYEATVETMKMGGSYDPNYMPELDWDKDVTFLNDLIDNGIVQKSFPVGLQKVFDEELGDYLAGRIDGTTLDNHLKSRVWLYLEESK